VFWP